MKFQFHGALGEGQISFDKVEFNRLGVVCYSVTPSHSLRNCCTKAQTANSVVTGAVRNASNRVLRGAMGLSWLIEGRFSVSRERL